MINFEESITKIFELIRDLQGTNSNRDRILSQELANLREQFSTLSRMQEVDQEKFSLLAQKIDMLREMQEIQNKRIDAIEDKQKELFEEFQQIKGE
jgi:hypothetical protein